MQKLFVDVVPIENEKIVLDYEQARHIGKSLRMRVGDMLTLCCGDGNDYGCIIDEISGDDVTLSVCYKQANNSELKIIFYEGGGEPLKSIVKADLKSASIYIGPEGGFEPEEVELLKESGAVVASLGKRILRTQTAPVAALSAIMLLTGNLE